MTSMLHAFAEMLREHGFALLIGTTVILTAFALIVRYSRSLSAKNRAASTAMIALAGYLIVALVPMPRFSAELATSPASGEPPANSGLLADGGQLPSWLSMPLTTGNSDGNLPSNASLSPNAAIPVPTRTAQIEATLAQLDPLSANTDAMSAAAMWLAGLIAVGILLFSAHLLFGFWHLRRILARSHGATAELTSLVTLPERTRLRIANAPVQPFCCGLLRPTIVLPRRLAKPSAETRFVLLHERAHLTSGDTRARLLCALLRPLMFWHPIYWWLQRQLRFTSELLADDAAAQGSVADYVRCMMTLSTHPDPAAGGALVATIFRRRSELFQRLEMMLQRNEAISRSHSPLGRWTRVLSTFVLVAVCAGTFGVDQAVAQSPRSDAVREQVRELRAELARLRHEIAQLSSEAAGATDKPVLPTLGRFVQVDEWVAGQDPFTIERGKRKPKTTTHTVKVGDSLAKIARQYYGTGSNQKIDDIRRLNPTVDPRRLRVGQKLRVAAPRSRKDVALANVFERVATWQSSPPLPPIAIAVATPPEGECVEAPQEPARAPRDPRAQPGVSVAGDSWRRSRRTGAAGVVVPAPARLPTERSATGVSAQDPRPARAARRAPTAGATTGPWRGPGAGPARANNPHSPSATGPSRGGPAGPRTARSRRYPAPPGPSGPSGAPNEEPPGPSGLRAGGATPRPTAIAAVAKPTRATGALGSLANLVTRCIELRGDVEIQEVEIRHANSVKATEIARIRLRTKKLQYEAIASMLKQELVNAEAELARSRKLQARGFISASELQATESKIALLTRALH